MSVDGYCEGTGACGRTDCNHGPLASQDWTSEALTRLATRAAEEDDRDPEPFLEFPGTPPDRPLTQSQPMREVLASLLHEIPASTPVYRDGERAYTAEEMAAAIDAGTPTALAYASDLLRVARDFLGRQASKKGSDR